MEENYPGLGKRLKLNIFNKYVTTQTALHDLSYLFWECTLRCNLNCLHCGSDCRSSSSIQDMPADDFLKITKQISKQYNPNKVMIVLTGGEPLLRTDLEYIGYELYKQGFPWGMVTNGYALNETRLHNFIHAGLRSLTISLDGFEESHNWLRGNSRSFEAVTKSISITTGIEELLFDVVTCVNQKNFEELPVLKEFLIGLGVTKWRLFTIFPTGRAASEPMLGISGKQFRDMLDFIKETRSEKIIKTSYGCEGFLGKYEGEVRDGFYFCRAGINIASVLADGSISACPNINHAYIQGNIYKDDFADIWNNSFEVMRNRGWTKTGKCSSCEVYKWCKGNGMHLHIPGNDEVLRCHYNMLNEINLTD